MIIDNVYLYRLDLDTDLYRITVRYKNCTQYTVHIGGLEHCLTALEDYFGTKEHGMSILFYYFDEYGLLNKNIVDKLNLAIKGLSGNDEYSFKSSSFKEVSAYDFIASQGEQEWIPKHEEEALFSKDNNSWKVFSFLRYLIGSSNPFVVMNSSNYKYCKPLSKVVSFVQFLKDNNAYEAYLENIEIWNQRWEKIKYYKHYNNVKNLNKVDWIEKAFNWVKQKEGNDFWDNLNTLWVNICENNEVIWE